jgi:hypothetical protein
MADSILTTPVETKELADAANVFIADQQIPLEQHSDVTVEELEKLSLALSE